MCSLAPCRDALGLGAAATSFLDRRRGVAAVVPAPATHRVGGAEVPSQKRGRDVDAAASPSSALRARMDKELVALQGLLKRAKLLPARSVAPGDDNNSCTPAPRRPEAVVSSSAPKRTTALQPKAATEAANQARNTPPAANSKQQQQRPVQQQRAAAETEALKKRRSEELARRAAAREEFRQMLLDMEKAALPDETIYPEELQELGITLEFVVTRTWKQAWLEDHAKKVKLVGV